ncbi:MAG: very short patch repair endonuclease [Phycisphaerae bacterium]
MTDTLTKAERSRCMSRIKSRNTGPEILVRRLLHRLGYRFRLKPQKLPGSPDIVLTRHRVVVFVHGCFWHRHRNCRLAYFPKSRIAFWRKKFTENRARDRRAARQLRHLGWRVYVVWECWLANQKALTRRLLSFLYDEGLPADRVRPCRRGRARPETQDKIQHEYHGRKSSVGTDCRAGGIVPARGTSA